MPIRRLSRPATSLVLVTLALMATACKPDSIVINQQALNDLSNTAMTGTPTVEPAAPAASPAPGSPAVEPVTPDPSVVQLSPELAPLVAPVTFRTIGSDGDAIVDASVVFDFSSGTTLALPNGDPVITASNAQGFILCAYAAAVFDYLCLHTFNNAGTERSWYYFDLDGLEGRGIYEYCGPEITDEICQEQLNENPDGAVDVDIAAPGTALAEYPPMLPLKGVGLLPR